MKPALLLALVLVAASVQAAPIDPVSIRHSAAEYEGSVTLGGGLVALLHREDPAKSTTSAAWTLVAEHIHVERDEAMAPDTGAVAIQSRPTTSQGSYRNADAEGHPRSGGYSLGLFPLPDAHAPLLSITANCLRSTTDAQGYETADRVVSGTGREPASARVAEAMKVLPCANAGWTVHAVGDFFLALYEWHTTVSDANGRHNWTSGTEYHQPAPGAPVHDKRMMQTYLTAHNATLTFTTPDPERLAAYATAIEGTVAGVASFADARTEDHRGHLDLSGSFSVSSHRVRDEAKTQLSGDMDLARLDGEPMDWTISSAAASPASPPSTFWAIILLGAAFGAVPLGGTIQRHRAQAWHRRHSNPRTGAGGHHEEAEYLYRQGDHRRALWHARRAVRFDPLEAWSWELRGQCHHALGHARLAGVCYERAYRILLDEAVNPAHRHILAYRISRTHALRRRGDHASAWLAIAAHHDPTFLYKAQDEGDFTHVKKHPDFTALLGRLTEWASP